MDGDDAMMGAMAMDVMVGDGPMDAAEQEEVGKQIEQNEPEYEEKEKKKKKVETEEVSPLVK